MAKEMTQQEKVKEAISILNELEKLLDERIVDLHQIKGMMQSRHAYCYYRKYVWDAIRMLERGA
jgi:hypothetical protein